MDNPSHESAPAAETGQAYRETLNRFIHFWGEMASRWGINRTMAQIHALLYASEQPLDTDEIMERLQISRGNANMNLRSLAQWNLVHLVHVPGSRKDYYTAEKDVWEITSQIIYHREELEIKPVRQQLDELRTHLSGNRAPHELPDEERQFHARIEALIDLMIVFEGFSSALRPLIRQRNAPLIRRLVAFAAKLRGNRK